MFGGSARFPKILVADFTKSAGKEVGELLESDAPEGTKTNRERISLRPFPNPWPSFISGGSDGWL